jgi:arsenate reductase
MKKVFYLKTCDTCKRILKELDGLLEGFQFQNIKETPVSESDLKIMVELSGSYEKLFSKRSQLYKKYDLKSKKLSESDFKKYILEHYTFLKRPVFIVNSEIFIGSDKSNIEELKSNLN